MADIVQMDVTNDNLGLLENIEEEMRKALILTLHQVGAKIEAVAVSHIENQDLDWAPLSTAHLAYKERKGYSEKIYIMTSTYMMNITHKVKEDKLETDIGVMRGVATTEDGHDVADIAAVLEYGKEGFTNFTAPPARPLWRPALEANRRGIQTMFGLAIHKVLKRIEEKQKGDPNAVS